MSYSPATPMDTKPEDEEPPQNPVPSWFTNANDIERADSLVARYREHALNFEQTRRSEDDQLNAFNTRLEEEIRQTRVPTDAGMEDGFTAPRRMRAAISPAAENFEYAAPRLARRHRKAKPTWPRYLAFGIAAMVLGGSLGYGMAKKDQIMALLGISLDGAKTSLTAQAQPVASATAAPAPQQAVVPAVMTVPAQAASKSDPAPAVKQVDAKQNQNGVTALPDPVAPGDNLVAKADALMAQGDVASARQLYLQADALGNAKGTYGVGRTYDPKVFAALKITGLQPDLNKAQDWYGRAAAADLSVP